MKKMLLIVIGIVSLSGCAATKTKTAPKDEKKAVVVPTPTVNYITQIDPYGSDNKDPFLTQLTMNYRSYAIYNTTVSNYPDIGELFAQKAVAAFSGQVPVPESLDNWMVNDPNEKFKLQSAYGDLQRALGGDALVEKPKLIAEAQAKFDCWISAFASGQVDTAAECSNRFQNTMIALNGGGGIAEGNKISESDIKQPSTGFKDADNRPDKAEMEVLTDTKRLRESTVVINNINIPKDLIRPPVVQPVVINQNIYSKDGLIGGPAADNKEENLGNQMVSREEFLNMMMMLRKEIQEIKLGNEKSSEDISGVNDTNITLSVQQIPESKEESKQGIMEEIFEIQFDFNKSIVKPEYHSVIQKLAETARNNKNVKISISGHTDTVGSDSYNYALGGRRADAVRQILLAEGVPASSVIVVSSGKNNLKVNTGNNIKSADNRRARIVKETKLTD